MNELLLKSQQLQDDCFNQIAFQLLQRKPSPDDAKDFTITSKDGHRYKLIAYMGIVVGAMFMELKNDPVTLVTTLAWNFDPAIRSFAELS